MRRKHILHDLRGAVSVIKTSAETLRAGAVDDRRYRQRFLRSICENADRLARDLSRLEPKPRRKSPPK